MCALPLHSPLPEPLGSPCRGAPVTGLPSASASALSRRTSLLSCTAPSLGSRAEQSRTQTLGPSLATSVQILLLHQLPVTLSHSGICLSCLIYKMGIIVIVQMVERIKCHMQSTENRVSYGVSTMFLLSLLLLLLLSFFTLSLLLLTPF